MPLSRATTAHAGRLVRPFAMWPRMLVLATLAAWASGGCGGGGSQGRTVVFTQDADFDAGVLVNVSHAAASGELRLSATPSTYPYIWVAASDRGTLLKVDTNTGAILGEYRTAPTTSGAPNPSRTTVSQDGSAWAGNRGDGSVVHIALLEANEAVDRNGNGVIDTSHGYGDVLPWPNTNGADSAGGVSTAEDECIVHYTRTSATLVRHLSVDAQGDVWVSGRGGTNDAVFDLIDGDTGAIVRSVGPFAAGGYGGLVDGQGVLWSASSSNDLLRFDTRLPIDPTNPTVISVPNYGLGIGPDGDLWVTNVSLDEVRRLSPAGAVLGTFSHGTYYAQGIAVDGAGHVWVASSHLGGTTVDHLRPDGTYVGSVTVGDGPTGVAVDAAGKVWSTNRLANTLTRIDPAAGPLGLDGTTPVGAVDLTVPVPGAGPYNYSDMTGHVALNTTAQEGHWRTAVDSGTPGTPWSDIRWNLEPQASLPAGASILVEARAADTILAIAGVPLQPQFNGAPVGLAGRFLEVRVTLRRGLAGASPVLSDLRVRHP